MHGRKWFKWVRMALGGLGTAALGAVLLYGAWEKPPVTAAQPELFAGAVTPTAAPSASARPTADARWGRARQSR